MALDLAAILKFAPLALKELKAYRRSDLAASLDRHVRAELERDPQLGPQVTDSLLNEWWHIHGDPRGAVLIAGLLREGDVLYLQALKVRSLEILDGLETLPLGIEETVNRLVTVVRNNFVAAQKDVENAAQRGTSAVLSAMDPLASREDVEELGNRIERMLSRPPERVLILPTTFDENQSRYIASLKSKNEPAAARLGEALERDGVEGVGELVDSPPEWAVDQPAAFWEAAARILSAAGRFPQAEAAFAKQAACPDVDDRVEAHVAAARCADADGRPDDADRLVDAARTEDLAHPSVKLFEASRAADATTRLGLADRVEPVTDLQRGRKESQRALAFLGLGRYDEARSAARASVEANRHGDGEELLALATILGARDKLPERDPDDRPVLEAVQYQLSLYEDLLRSERVAAAGVAGARAALGTAVLEDRAATAEAIDRILSVEGTLEEQEARETLVAAAMTSGNFDKLAVLLPSSDTSQESRVLRASAAVMTGEDPVSAAADLDEVLSELEAGDLRDQAVAMRLLAATDEAVTLDTEIAEGHERADLLIAHVRARRTAATGDLDAARALLAGLDDPMSLELRAELAERQDRISEAIGLQAALTRKHRNASNMLRLAALKMRAGDFPGAIREALRLATDERKLRSARDAAFEIAAEAAIAGGDYEELEDISDRWAELSPEREDPRWTQAFALARQRRYGDALEFVRRQGLEPTADANRHLFVAELYLHGISDGAERMRSLMELSERFGRPVELERAFIGGVLKTPTTDRPDDPTVIARFQESISTFDEKFPDATGITKITIDPADDGDAIVEKLIAASPRESQETSDARQEAIDGVRQGRFPMGFLAAMVGRSTAETVVRNGAHPLAVIDHDTHEREVEAASQALDAATASWDETACITVSQLADEGAPKLTALLPDSTVGQTVRDSLAEAVSLQMGGEQVATMQILPDGTPRIIEEDPATVARIRVVQEAASTVASGLRTTPDRGLGNDRLAQTLDADEAAAPAAACMSALLVARDGGIPLYSDDRVLRAFARGFDLPAFGTIALIDAAARRGLLSEEQAAELLTAVIDLGVWSLALDPPSYVTFAKRMDFDLSRCVRPLLSDEVTLRSDPRVLHNAHVLSAVADEAPDKLPDWAASIVESYRAILQVDPMLSSSLLVAALFDPNAVGIADEVRSRNMAVIHALRNVDGVGEADTENDPLVGAVRRWLHAAPEEERDTLLKRLLEQVDEATADELRKSLGEDLDS